MTDVDSVYDPRLSYDPVYRCLPRDSKNIEKKNMDKESFCDRGNNLNIRFLVVAENKETRKGRKGIFRPNIDLVL